MPPRGGNPSLPDDTVGLIVDHMIAQAKSAAAGAPVKAPSASAASTPREKPPAKVETVSARPARISGVNAFNRLMKPPSQRNPSPMRDGIHDPGNDGTELLQHPREAFSPLPKANTGNRVDWVAALDRGDIAPWFDLEDESRKPVVLDLNIVREVKGSMPDVVYPHKQHTEWLDCSNCHPSIFFQKKGANNISMASILLGEKCGVCHGKVAFPVSDCRRCHSKNKPKAAKK